MITRYIYIVSPIPISNDFELKVTGADCSVWCMFDILVVFSPWHLFPASGYIWHLTMRATNLMAGSYGWDSLKTLYVKKNSLRFIFLPLSPPMTFVLVYSTVVCITAWHHIMTSLRHNLKSTVQTSEVFALNSLQTFLQFYDFFTVAPASVERCHSRSTDANTKKRSVVWSRRLAYFHDVVYLHLYIYISRFAT